MLISGIVEGLVVAGIGAAAGKAGGWLLAEHHRRQLKRIWNPDSLKKCVLVLGEYDSMVPDGEVEPTVNREDALTLGELRWFAEQLFVDVDVVPASGNVDWSGQVVTLGGPVSNRVTREVGSLTSLPYWFDGVDSGGQGVRTIVRDGEQHLSEFSGSELCSDIGFFARVRSPHNAQREVILIASNYGAGNWGVARHMREPENCKVVRARVDSRHFQVVIRTYLKDGDYASSRLVAAVPIS